MSDDLHPLRDPKPSYETAIEAAIGEWLLDEEKAHAVNLDKEDVKKFAGRIMRKIRDAGIVIGLDDGTKYADRT